MTAEQKAELIEMLEKHDTTEVSLMEDINYGRQNSEVMLEAKEEQNDPPDQRPLTDYIKNLIRQMREDDNLSEDAEVPEYLLPEVQNA